MKEIRVLRGGGGGRGKSGSGQSADQGEPNANVES